MDKIGTKVGAMRTADEMNKYTKECIDSNIDRFYENICSEIQDKAENGIFNCCLNFSASIHSDGFKLPWKSNKSGLEYTKERLEIIGYKVEITKYPKYTYDNGVYSLMSDEYAKMEISWGEN